jgi:anti-sigma B factor antagonist
VDIEVEIARSPTHDVVHVRGVVDLSTAPTLDESLSSLVHAPGAGPLIIDLSDARFIDSSGLNVLVTAGELLAEGGSESKVRLVVTRPVIREALEVTGLDQVFELYESLADATA